MLTPEFHRRSIRIQGADYTQPGAYFVTICAANRRNIFGRIEEAQVVLSRLGEFVRECWIRIPEHFPVATPKEFIVMPNHLHGIIALGVGARYIVPTGVRTTEEFQKPIKNSIPTIVRTFKAAVSRCAKESLGWNSHMVWQRNYFERVLRDSREYGDAVRYILENPLRWEWDKEDLAANLA